MLRALARGAAPKPQGLLRGQRRGYFNKVMVANRGEIACRVMSTCQKLGIPTVAIYSEADAKAKHVKMADEAYCVGPPPSAESYLQQERILEICQKAGVDAVHPGYGFLSENATFSKLLAQNGVTFVGPKEEAIAAMGDKIESKRFAMHSGVNIIPGHDGEVENEEQLLAAAKEVGYPIMMKASAGGGGKGMRIAWSDEDAISGFRLSKMEAMASFGDDRMLVEKFVNEPRHIEIQIIADKNGNVVYLPERECSIQRRNQKVIEEAPSTFITPEIRKEMGEQAAALARAVDYHTAGTVEMMVDKDKNFYFLEMNTRLQVEHPVTELITGLDLVDEMLRAAAGKDLSVKQEDIGINGWATESRVYAEDPLKDYLPVIGRLNRYVEPKGEGVRVDSGLLEGSEISVYYDPMICKLCTWGKNREESRLRMIDALDQYVIRGLGRNNINLLRDVLLHERYISGNITTKFLAEEYKEGYPGHTLTASEEEELALISVFAHNEVAQLRKSIPNGEAKLAVQIESGNWYNVTLNTDENEGQITGPVANPGELPSGNEEARLFSFHSAWMRHDPIISLGIRTGDSPTMTTVKAQLLETNYDAYKFQYVGSQYNVKVYSEEEAKVAGFMLPPAVVDESRMVLSPMPGVIVDYHVKEGDQVKAGQDVVTLEAMKMRNALQAVSDAVVKEIRFQPGNNVEDGEVLLTLEPIAKN